MDILICENAMFCTLPCGHKGPHKENKSCKKSGCSWHSGLSRCEKIDTEKFIQFIFDDKLLYLQYGGIYDPNDE